MRPPHSLKAALCLVIWLSAGSAVFAHGDLHERILALSAKILTEPGNAQLRMQRAELYRQHEEWKPALSDCDDLDKLAPGIEVDMLRGRTLFEAGRPGDAVPVLDRVIGRRPDDGRALICRARSLSKLGRFAAASADYTRALGHLAEPQPEFFIERAYAMNACGQDGIAGLDEGIAKLGPAVTLEMAAIDLELVRKNYDGALRRVARQAARSERKERWLAQEGDILMQAGRTKEAQAAYESGLKAIGMLPERLKKTESIEKLRLRLRDAIERAKFAGREP